MLQKKIYLVYKLPLFLLLIVFSLHGCHSSLNKKTTCNNNTVKSKISDNPIRVKSGAITEHYAALRKQQIHNVAYQVSIKLDKLTTSFSGAVKIDLVTRKKLQQPLTLDFKSGTIKTLMVNQVAVAYSWNGMFITLEPQLFVNGANKIEVTFEHPYTTDGSGLYRFVDPEDGKVYLYSQFEPYDTNRVFPLFDQPDIKANFTLDVIAPSDWRVISTTQVKTKKSQDNKTQWFFGKSAIISSYVFSLHAGPYRVWQSNWKGVPLRLFSRQSLAQYVKTEDWFEPTQKFLDFYSNYFAIDYPFAKYDQLIVPDFNFGAMENVAAVTFSERFIKKGDKTQDQRQHLANVIAHEMAHMWFGDLVTMKWWNGLWLNESFATVMANIALADSGYNNVWEKFYSNTKQWAYWTDDLVTTHPIELPVNNTAEAFSNFDGITYGKGASVLKQLRHYLGNEIFRQGVRIYLKRHAYANSTLSDFTDALSQAAGQPLQQWQQQWLTKAGANTIEVDYLCEQQKIKYLSIKQTAPLDYPVLRQQRIKIAFFKLIKSDMKQIATIPVTYLGSTTQVTAAQGLPCPDLIYPNADDWGYVKVNLDKNSKQTLQKTVNAFKSPLLRLMLWQSMWDNVRDAKTSLYDFLDFTIENISEETNIDVQQQVQKNLISAYDYLNFNQSNKKSAYYRQQLETLSLKQLKNALAETDSQKNWFDTLVNVTSSKKTLTYLNSLLLGKSNIQGLTIDQDRRWAIVNRLNRFQYNDYIKLTKQELKLDTSERAQQQLIAAQAVRANFNIKQKWLTKIITKNDNFKLRSLRQATEYLFPSEQASLHEEFVDAITDALYNVSASENSQYIAAFSKLLSGTCNQNSVARLTKMTNSMQNYDPLLKKKIRISLQEDQRCLKIVSMM